MSAFEFTPEQRKTFAAMPGDASAKARFLVGAREIVETSRLNIASYDDGDVPTPAEYREQAQQIAKSATDLLRQLGQLPRYTIDLLNLKLSSVNPANPLSDQAIIVQLAQLAAAGKALAGAAEPTTVPKNRKSSAAITMLRLLDTHYRKCFGREPPSPKSKYGKACLSCLSAAGMKTKNPKYLMDRARKG